LEQSLDALPAPVIRRHPRLCLAQAQMLIQFGDLGESEEWLDDALALVSQGIAMDDEVEAANGATLIMDEIAQAHNTIIQSRQDRPSVERGADPLSLPAVTAHMRGQGAHTPITMPRHTETRHSSIAPGEVPIVFESLSAREMEVLQLLAEGESNQEIAHDLVIAVATVKRHLGNIFRKLAAQSRTQAVARARALQLLHDQPATPALTPPLFQGDHQAREIRQRHGLSWRGYPRPSTNGNGNGSIAPGFA
ncbi:MAG TPA: LuxR C-terminal-related transcriptional regulator, partial [Ktedonobacterales bacterium]|nr:LuxR C-terminal-related transcriptional regulator [Ktedonobacterales bacterium]